MGHEIGEIFVSLDRENGATWGRPGLKDYLHLHLQRNGLLGASHVYELIAHFGTLHAPDQISPSYLLGGLKEREDVGDYT